jgi:hypothetical protein
VLIYACISAHGYGHGSRTIAVLAELASLRPDWRLVVSTALPEPFLRQGFGGVPFERRRCRWDVGVVQADALAVDAAATLEALGALVAGLGERIGAEAAWLEAQRQPVLVLGDVPPDAARLATRLGVPLIWLASFGWDAIYGAMGEAFRPWAERSRRLYARGDLLLRCPLALPMDWGVPSLPIGITHGRPRFAAEELRRRLALPEQRGPCVLLNFGGLGMALDPSLPARWPDHVFLGADAALAELPHGRPLPAGVRPLDVLPLVERMITKPGYSSFCEAFSQDVGIHLVRRDGFAEAPVLEAALKRHGRHRLLDQAQWHAGDWELDLPLLPPTEGPLEGEGARRAAEAIVSWAEKGSADSIVDDRTV